MDDNMLFVYLVKIPGNIDEFVVPCKDGYTVYIDKDLTYEQQRMAYNHAVCHIQRGDFDGHGKCVDRIEAECDEQSRGDGNV